MKQFGPERHLDLQADLHKFFGGLFSGKTILDVGAGLGRSKERLGANQVTTHDVSPHVADLVDVVAPEPPRGPYDIVTAFEVLEHVEDDLGFLRLLDERATQAIFLTTPRGTGRDLSTSSHYREYTARDLYERLMDVKWPVERAFWGAYLKNAAGGWCTFLPFQIWYHHSGLKHVVLVDKRLPPADRERLRWLEIRGAVGAP